MRETNITIYIKKIRTKRENIREINIKIYLKKRRTKREGMEKTDITNSLRWYKDSSRKRGCLEKIFTVSSRI